LDAPILSLLPPLIAIVLAVVMRRVYLPLTVGVLVGSFLLADRGGADGGALPLAWGVMKHFAVSLYSSVTDPSHVQVLIFSLLLGAMVGVLESGGAMASLLGLIAGKIKSRRGAQMLISLSGLAIFFDDYANTLLIGGTFRSTADRYRISRAKLAYLVDSTAAPVAGLALVSTWVVTEISYLEDGLRAAGSADAARAFPLFIASIPYRFYPWLAIAMVMMVSASGRDFGPMRRAEQEAVDEAESDRRRPKESGDDASIGDVLLAAVLPVLMCVVAVLATLIWTGRPQGPDDAGANVSLLKQVGDVVGGGDSYLALIVGGGVGLLLALLGGIRLGITSVRGNLIGGLAGAGLMMPAMLVLWLAWALSAMTQTDQLDTSGYLSGLLSDRLDVRLLPTAVFVLSGLVAFSTGTSWGTMAILTPIAVALSLNMDPAGGAGGAIFLATFGSVLAGAIFGDHCSPISDTTVLSSRACRCDHITHVRTQMPYAITVAVVCILTGTLPVAFGLSPWLSLILGAVCLWVTIRCFGRPVAAA